MEGAASPGPRAPRQVRRPAARRAAAAARRARAAARLTLSTETHEALEPLRAPWTELAERSGNLFATFEWAEAWWRHYGRGHRARPVLCRDEAGDAVAVLPICVMGARPVRVARFIGHGRADQQGPVGDDPRALEALRELPYEALLAERLPEGDAGRLGGRELRSEASPVIDIAGLSWDDYLASRSSNFRSQVRRKERKLLRESGLAYRLADESTLDADMEILLRLHAARWAEGESSAFTDRHAAFHRDFARVALRRGWLRLWIAEADGRPVAAWHGFRFAGAEWYYQFGRDPDWERSSIGVVLLAHTVRAAIEDGMSEYKLLRGGESYKDRFATGDRPVVSVAVGHGPAGRAIVAAGAKALDLRGPARELISRARTRARHARGGADPSTTPPPSE